LSLSRDRSSRLVERYSDHAPDAWSRRIRIEVTHQCVSFLSV